MKTSLKTFVGFILGIWNAFLFGLRRILFRMSRILERRSKKDNWLTLIEPLELSKISSIGEYQVYCKSMGEEFIKRKKYEQEVIGRGNFFSVPGFCYVCNRRMKFFVDRSISYKTLDNKAIPNWREQLHCPGCNLNNRMRTSIQFFEQTVKAKKDHSIYILEQISPFFVWMSNNYQNVSGSEYLGNRVSFGKTTFDGIRNEDVTRLTFEDNTFDFILSFDVFEHVPDYLKAIRECLRCLKPGGQLLLSVPFDSKSQNNIARAKIDSQGELKFLFPPPRVPWRSFKSARQPLFSSFRLGIVRPIKK